MRDAGMKRYIFRKVASEVIDRRKVIFISLEIYTSVSLARVEFFRLLIFITYFDVRFRRNFYNMLRHQYSAM